MKSLAETLRGGAWRGAMIWLAVAASLAAARAEDGNAAREPNLPGDAALVPSADAPPEFDFTPTGAINKPAQASSTLPSPEPALAPQPQPTAAATPEAAQTPPSAVVSPDALPEPAPAAPAALDVADLLPGALEALLARAGGPNPLGAGDWRAALTAVQSFYSARAFAPVFVDATGLSPAGRSALARLKRAGEDGLDLSAFALPDEKLASLQAARLADAEATLSAAVVAYAMQASGVRIIPSSISPLITAHPTILDPLKALSEVAAAPDSGEALAAFNPPQKGYRDLRDQLARLSAAAPVAERPAGGPTLKIGMADPRVPLIRARFGLGSMADAKSAGVYDARVASAVAAFQKTRGLAGGGLLTEATSEALFGDPDAARAASIRANMEMWRWEPRDMGRERIEINVPDFSLHVMDGDEETHGARVIVGKPDTPTPIFSNEVKYILVNPAWRVPQSIIRKEMMPKLANDPDYLTKHGFKVTEVGGHIEVEQPPGEGNALGHILFMFPNEHSVYLHDTPSRSLFATSRRAYSHGCVRVEQPMRLAELLMGGAARGWSEGRIQSMIGSNERAIFLPKPLPIHIEYFTDFVDENGALRERDDVYGLTGRVAATLSRLRQD